jgi:hypothetical protein
MGKVASHGIGSLGLRCVLRCDAICPADSELEAVGSLSNIALSTLLHVYQDPYFLPDIGSMDDNTNLAAKLVDVWAWLFFAVNTSMTMSIIYKIL